MVGWYWKDRMQNIENYKEEMVKQVEWQIKELDVAKRLINLKLEDLCPLIISMLTHLLIRQLFL